MRRLLGLDALRFFSVIAICQFHAVERLFYRDWTWFHSVWSLNYWLEPYSRFMSFSGLTIVGLSAFLIGFKPWSEKNWQKTLLLVIIGFFVLGWVEGSENNFFYFEWDIYPYLMVTLIVLYGLRHYRQVMTALSVLGFVVLSFPIWNWEHLLALPTALQSAVWGVCSEAGGGGWPLLPWLFLPIIFFRAGDWLAEKPQRMMAMRSLQKWERAFWPVSLTLSLFHLGGYFLVPVGPGFNCFIHRQDPVVMWSHLIWVIFIIRISFLDSIQNRLYRSPLARGISKLHWSRHFGRCYIIQFVLIGMAARYGEMFSQSEVAFDALVALIIPVTELASRGLEFALNWKPQKANTN